MALSTEQLSLIQKVNEKIQRGDITKISKDTGFTKEYVGKVLNPFSVTYNDEIVNAAIIFLRKREQGRKRLLQALPV